MTALSAFGALLLFTAACGFVVLVGWLAFRIHELRVHREAIEHRLSEIAHGDSFPHPILNREQH